ncbi:MAG: hypothetical protein GY750_14670 [Lentisphaerae bacterium]|nr:hypothetical protein [Lentisphaerota bacterium]MCP4102645.1 hypothetical protein [Lentisphaerota bacterium]
MFKFFNLVIFGLLITWFAITAYILAHTGARVFLTPESPFFLDDFVLTAVACSSISIITGMTILVTQYFSKSGKLQKQ